MKKDHPDHQKQIHRIKRIKGQLEGVQKMIEEQRYCPDILQQTKAIVSAIRSLEAKILEKHLESCVKQAFVSGSKKEQEQKRDELIKLYLKTH